VSKVTLNAQNVMHPTLSSAVEVCTVMGTAGI